MTDSFLESLPAFAILHAMNGFRITLLVLLCLAVTLMFYAVMVVVPSWQNQYGEYQASQKLAEYQRNNDFHRLRMEQFAPEAESPEVAQARAAAEESARKGEQALTEAEESSVIAAAKRKEEATLAKQAEVEANAPKPLGLVAAFDQEWNILMIKPVSDVPLHPGYVVAVRRDGRIVCEAVIDVLDSESGQYSATLKVADLGKVISNVSSEASLQPAVGDEIIESPFPSSAELRGNTVAPASVLPDLPADNGAVNDGGLPVIDASLTPVP